MELPQLQNMEYLPLAPQTWGSQASERARPLTDMWTRVYNSLAEQLDTHRDSLLLLRQMVITALAHQARASEDFHSFLDHSRDPVECSRAPAASRCSSRRPCTTLAHLGEAIAPLAQFCAQEVQRSINGGDRKHPFSDELLKSTRHNLAQAVGLGPEDTEEVAAGQPFHLNLITAIAEYGGDIDAMSPLQVTTPTWTSPGIWPTKEEVKGESPVWEDLLLPLGRDNYPSTNVVRPTHRPPKVHWSLVVAADFLLTVVNFTPEPVFWTPFV